MQHLYKDIQTRQYDFIHFSHGDIAALLTHWGWVIHICISTLTSISADNGLAPGQCQAIIWTNDKILLIEPLETNFSETLNHNSNIFIQENASKNAVWKMTAILS